MTGRGDTGLGKGRGTRIAVVGGGLAGASAAHRVSELLPEASLSLLEASDRLGGSIGTEEADGYLVERGADMFITEKTAAVRLCERLGLSPRLIAPEERDRRSLVWRDGGPVEVPAGFKLMAPSRLGPLLKTPLLSPLGKLRMAADLWLPRGGDEPDESIADFVRRRFGQEALERLVQPLVGGIWTGDPARLSLQATLPRFLEMERRHRSLIAAGLRGAAKKKSKESGARYGLFVTLPQGMGELIDALETRLRAQAEVHLTTPASGLARTEAGFRVGAGERSLEVDAVIVALPAYGAAKLLAEVAPPLVRPLEGIPYASSAVVVTGHRLADVRHPLDAFGMVVPAAAGRRVIAVSFASRKFPGRAPEGRVLLRTFVGGAMQPQLCEGDDSEILSLVRQELREMLGVSGEPDLARVMRHDRAMPQYELGHLDRLAQIEAEEQRQPGLALAGSYFRGVGIPDTIARAEEAAERIVAGLRIRRRSSRGGPPIVR